MKRSVLTKEAFQYLTEFLDDKDIDNLVAAYPLISRSVYNQLMEDVYYWKERLGKHLKITIPATTKAKGWKEFYNIISHRYDLVEFVKFGSLPLLIQVLENEKCAANIILIHLYDQAARYGKIDIYDYLEQHINGKIYNNIDDALCTRDNFPIIVHIAAKHGVLTNTSVSNRYAEVMRSRSLANFLFLNRYLPIDGNPALIKTCIIKASERDNFEVFGYLLDNYPEEVHGVLPYLAKYCGCEMLNILLKYSEYISPILYCLFAYTVDGFSYDYDKMLLLLKTPRVTPAMIRSFVYGYSYDMYPKVETPEIWDPIREAFKATNPAVKGMIKLSMSFDCNSMHIYLEENADIIYDDAILFLSIFQQVLKNCGAGILTYILEKRVWKIDDLSVLNEVTAFLVVKTGDREDPDYQENERMRDTELIAKIDKLKLSF